MERDSKGHFIKGYSPWNKGTNGIMKANRGSFKKGDSPWHKGTKGLKKANQTSFKNGHSSWCKGTKGVVKATKGSFKKGNKVNQIVIDKNKLRIGKLHPNWKGGVTSLSKKLKSSPKWIKWRETIFNRDNYTCQKENCKFCNNKRGTKLHPHHIKHLSDFPELAFDINNGITYCKGYHLKNGLHVKIKRKDGVSFQ